MIVRNWGVGMRKARASVSSALLATVLAILLPPPTLAQERVEPVIVKRCENSGKCSFTVAFPGATTYLATYWWVNSDSAPVLVAGTKPFVHYFSTPGDYTIGVLVVFENKAPVKAQTTFTILPLERGLQRILDETKTFVFEYVLPVIAAIAIVLQALGVNLV